MANDKKNRRPPARPAQAKPANPGATARPASGGAKGATTAATTVRPAPATPGGPNRQARKDAARREREALQRKMRRRRTYRVLGAVLVVLVAAAAIGVYLTVFRQTPAEAAGCGPLEHIAPYQPARDDRVHIGPSADVATPPPLSSYRSSPPTSGPHLPPGEQLPAGVYTSAPNVYSAIHSLEHGAVIIWYRPGLRDTALSEIQTYFRDPANVDHVIVAPYNYPKDGAAGRLKSGEDVALVFWHHLEFCQRPSLAVAKDFVAKYRIKTATAGQVPVLPPGYPRDGAPEAGASL